MNEVTSLSQFTRLRQPLTIGDIVSIGLAIAKQRWRLFCGISLRAIAWMILPAIGVAIGTTFMATMSSPLRSSQASNYGIGVLLFVVWLVGTLFCFGKYLANAGLISRIAFNDLTQREESVNEAARVTRSLTWSYLGASLIYGGIFIGASIVLGFILSLGFVLIVFILGLIATGLKGSLGLGGNNTTAMGLMGVVAAIGVLLFFLGYITALTWVMTRFFFSEVPLSIEPKIGSLGAIGRSWELSTKSSWRLMTIATVGVLVTIPITVLGQLITVLPLIFVTSGNSLERGSVLVTGLTNLLNLVSSLVITLMTMGFWQAVKAVVYFDLLNRREGKALELQQ